MTALDLGAFHISQALRRSESQYYRFQRQSISMNHLEYLNLDILIVLLGVIILVYKA